jgi:hypothetical protein
VLLPGMRSRCVDSGSYAHGEWLFSALCHHRVLCAPSQMGPQVCMLLALTTRIRVRVKGAQGSTSTAQISKTMRVSVVSGRDYLR